MSATNLEPDGGGREATRLTRRAANAAALAVIAFGALFVIGAQVQAFRAHSPWANDPYDAVGSFAVLLVPVVVAVTFVRLWRWRGAAPMPAPAIRQVLRGSTVTVGAIDATVAADVAALLARASVETRGPWLGLLVGLLASTGLAALGATALLVLAWSRSRRYVADGARNSAQEEDAFDDIVALLVDVGRMTGRRLPRLGERLVAGSLRLDAALRFSRVSPRRHPWAYCFVVAVTFGLAFSAWHSLVEGMPPDLSSAFLIWLLYAGILATCVIVGYALFGHYLRLIRAERGASSSHPTDAR
jgi:hypothetical protein